MALDFALTRASSKATFAVCATHDKEGNLHGAGHLGPKAHALGLTSHRLNCKIFMIVAQESVNNHGLLIDSNNRPVKIPGNLVGTPDSDTGLHIISMATVKEMSAACALAPSQGVVAIN